MALLIGTDEAGYGPPLGPLVITATGWRCQQRESNLNEILSTVVTDSLKLAKTKNAEPRILVADSKTACRSGSIATLELSVLVLLKVVFGEVPATLRELTALVMPEAPDDLFENQFWLKDADVSLPIVASDDRLELIAELADQFERASKNNSVELKEIRSTIIFPPEFNAALVSFGNKAHLLSDRTLQLIQNLIENGHEDTLVECDKHGGRNYYLPLIQEKLTRRSVTAVHESPASSIYRWSEDGKAMEIRFTAKGETQLPVALASMVSKYLREAFMVAWNNFWRELVPDLKPTKGYPVDAKRFLSEIKHVAASRRHFRHDFWRNC